MGWLHNDGLTKLIIIIIMIIIVMIIIPCKPYLSASATAPHPLGRRKVERLFSLFSVSKHYSIASLDMVMPLQSKAPA
jgi:hypothetical protein